MDQIKNPFAPGAGSPPPELAGRGGVLEQARVLLGRIRRKRPEKSLLLTGLRGVGKTVLLNEIARMAIREEYRVIQIEALEDKRLPNLLVPELRRLLYELDRIKGAGDKVRRGLSVLKSFMSAFKLSYGEFSIDIDAEKGSADSGYLEVDLPNLLVAVAEAAEERQTAVAILIDEIQYFGSKDLSALIVAMHRLQQRQLPMILVGAGLPILPGLIGESKSYAERLFNFPDIGPLSESDAIMALKNPVEAAGAKFEAVAMHKIYEVTKGYPYFIQEWGYQAWNYAPTPVISAAVVDKATPLVTERLDQNFFRVRFDRLTPSEKRYLRTMAQLGAGPYRTSDISAEQGEKSSTLGPVRAHLIKKGMIYSPAHGITAFTVPLFDEFMRRAIPEFHPETTKSVTTKRKKKKN